MRKDLLKSAPQPHGFLDFSLGLDWSSTQDKIDQKSLYDANNVNLNSFRTLERRNGISAFAGQYANYPIMSLYEYIDTNGNSTLFAQCGTKLGEYDGSWADLKTGLTENKRLSMASHNNYCFCTNGTDANFKIRDSIVYDVGLPIPDAPTCELGTSTGHAGVYNYALTYVRSADMGIFAESNPSELSSVVDNDSGKDIIINYVASSSAEIDKIRIYRTFDQEEAGMTTQLYLVAEVDNATSHYHDSKTDDELTSLWEQTHTAPPKATFVMLHQDRMFYANCPDEPNGESLFMFSESGQPEYCPASNYQYFDRGDGLPITGVASLPDYFLVFKRRKIAVMQGNFETWVTLSDKIGCIAPWAIVQIPGAIMFLSESGWKVTDGKTIFDVSKRLANFINLGHISWGSRNNYSAAYYPNKKQVYFLTNETMYPSMMMVGHVLSLLYMDVVSENTVDEPYIGWTYHTYDHHTFSCLGNYTDSNGTTVVIAGSTDGKIWTLDQGLLDDTNNIYYSIQTGWSSLGMPESITKILRFINVSYSAGPIATDDVQHELVVNADFVSGVDSILLSGGAGVFCGEDTYCGYTTYCGADGVTSGLKPVNDSCVGRMFQFWLKGTTSYPFTLRSIWTMSRLGGLRAD